MTVVTCVVIVPNSNNSESSFFESWMIELKNLRNFLLKNNKKNDDNVSENNVSSPSIMRKSQDPNAVVQ